MITDVNYLYLIMNTLVHKAHFDQKYGEEPYINHLREVEAMVDTLLSDKEIREAYNSYGGPSLCTIDEFVIIIKIVALGHDLIEDTDQTEKTLLNLGFLPIIVMAILSMSKRPGESKDDYITRVMQNPLGLMGKKCDSTCNLLRSIKGGNTKWIMKYTDNLRQLTKCGW